MKKRLKSRIFVILLFIVTGLNAQPTTANQDTLTLALHQAVLMALENNPTVNIQRLAPEIMQTVVNEYRSAFDPTIGATGQQSQVKSLRRLGAERTPFDLRDNRFDYEATLSETLPTGTRLQASTSMTGSISNLYTDQFTGNVGLTITQSLLKGFGASTNLASLRKANIDVEISELELKGVAEGVVAAIESGYWNLYLAAQEMEIQQKSLELAQQQLSESLERVAVGKLPKLELAAVDAELAARRGDMIDAQSAYEQARLQFLFLLNPDVESIWQVQISPTDYPFMPTDTLDSIFSHEKVGIQYRADLQQARLSLEKGELDITRTKNGLLPRLDVFINLGRTSYSETFGSDAYPDLSSPFYQAVLGFDFAFPVPNRRARAQLARAKYTREQQDMAVKNMEKMVQWDVRSSYTEVNRARQQIVATKVTREMQEKSLAAELEKFRVGKSTNYLVLQAQRDFTASQLQEARAMVAHLNALIDLYVSEGTLLERRGVTP